MSGSSKGDSFFRELKRYESVDIYPENLHVISHEFGLYRSGQPNRAELLELEKYGFKSVLCLRCRHKDTELLSGLHMKEYHFPIYMITEDEMIEVLTIISKAEKPILFHCLLGCDRTGAVAVGCRIVFDGWTIDQALEEFNADHFGGHRLLYHGYQSLLRNMNWERIKNAVPKMEKIRQTQPEAKATEEGTQA